MIHLGLEEQEWGQTAASSDTQSFTISSYYARPSDSGNISYAGFGILLIVKSLLAPP